MTPSSRNIATPTVHAHHTPPLRLAVIGLIGLMVLLVAIQLVPYGRDHANPPVRAEPTWDQPQTRALFFRACGDCHSNQTVWPWYSNVAPLSWLAQRDVQEGRRAFNVSEWGGPENHGDEAAETVQNGTMPVWFYTMVHPAAQLSPSERQAFIAGLIATFGSTSDNGGEGGE